MINKFDMKIAHVQSTCGTAAIVADAVPTGRTMFVCRLKYGMSQGGNNVSVGESDACPWTKMESVKDVQIDLGANGTNVFPDKVDIDYPLFSIAAGRKLVYTGRDTDTEIIAVYYIAPDLPL